MTTAYALRALMDLSLYLTAASLPGAFFGQTSPMALAEIWIAICCGLCYACGDKEKLRALRYVATAAIAAAFLEARTAAEYILIAPAVGYAVYLCLAKRTAPDYPSVLDRFSFGWKTLAVLSAIQILIGQWNRFTALTAPNALLFLLSAIMLLRMLRHDESVLRRREFRVRNDLTVAAVLAASLAFGSEVAKAAFVAVLRGFWRAILQPILRLIGYLLVGLFELIGKVMQPVLLQLNSSFSMDTTALKEALDLSELMEREAETAAQADYTVLINILWGAGALVALIALALLFRYLARNRNPETQSRSRDERESLSGETLPDRPFWDLPPRDDGERVRWYYRRYMALAKKRGQTIRVSDTVSDIQRASIDRFDDINALAVMRTTYERARYRAQEAALPKDAKTAKDAFERLRSARTH